MQTEENIQIIPASAAEVIEAQEKASYDIQIVTAKRFPRDVKRSRDNSIAIATMDEDTAKSCGYALPRGGKPIQGPSVHLARILAQNWGNIRVESKVSEITHNQVVSQAVCFDLENNYAVKVEVRKKIVGSKGQRYNDDMITVTGNAANSIAFRNAVFAVIPKAVTDSVYKATRNLIAGDLSSEEKMIKRRNQAVEYFKDNYGATEEEILQVLGVGSMNAIRQDQIVLLLDLDQAIKDGDTTPADAFGRLSESDKKKKEAADKLKEGVKQKIQESVAKKNEVNLQNHGQS